VVEAVNKRQFSTISVVNRSKYPMSTAWLLREHIYRNSACRWKMSKVVPGVAVCIDWMYPTAKSAHVNGTMKLCTVRFHGVELCIICSAQQLPLMEHSRAAVKASFHTVMDTVRRRGGLSAIVASSYLLT